MTDLRPPGMNDVGEEKRWVSLAILGQEDGSLTLWNCLLQRALEELIQFFFHKRGMVGNCLDLSQIIFPLDIIFF